MGDCRTRTDAKTSRMSGKGGFTADVYTLDRRISAIPLCSSESNNNRPTLGPVTQLPTGSQMQVCGEGFNDRTVKVRCNGAFFFVFVADLNLRPVR